jgi:hypothetical protein
VQFKSASLLAEAVARTGQVVDARSQVDLGLGEQQRSGCRSRVGGVWVVAACGAIQVINPSSGTSPDLWARTAGGRIRSNAIARGGDARAASQVAHRRVAPDQLDARPARVYASTCLALVGDRIVFASHRRGGAVSAVQVVTSQGREVNDESYLLLHKVI